VSSTSEEQPHPERLPGSVIYYGTSRTRAFRSSFLTPYAHRIGERLQEVTQEEAEAAVGPATCTQTGSRQELVRVLGVRTAAVDDVAAAMFPHLVQRAVGSTNDVEGWDAGRRAADGATLSGRERAVAR
jgi:hypothetical protein